MDTAKDREILQSLNGMDKYIAKGIETKLDIVVADEKEQGVRKFLNLGHRFGHAVEYKPQNCTRSCRNDRHNINLLLRIYCSILITISNIILII